MDELKRLKLLVQQKKMEMEDKLRDTFVDTLCYHIPYDRYFYYTDGKWQLHAALKKTAAINQLTTMGYSMEEALVIIKNGQHPKVHGIKFFQSSDTLIKQGTEWFINGYVPPTLQPSNGDFPRIKKILKNLTDNDTKGCEYIFNWLAFKVQNPLDMPLTAIIFHGPQGSGKGTFESIIREMIGRKNCTNLGPIDLNGQFNSHFINGLFAFCDEALAGEGFRENSQKLKQLITDKHIMCSTKSLPLYEVDNKLALIFSSNQAKPVEVEVNDRRYNVFRGADVRFGDEYTIMLRSCYKTKSEFSDDFMIEIGAFFGALLNHTVDHHAVRTPYENEARQELINQSKSGFQVWWDELNDLGTEFLISEYKDKMITSPEALEDDGRHYSDGVYYSCELVHMMHSRWCKNSGYRDMGRNKFYGELKNLRIERVQFRIPNTELRIYCFKGLPQVTPEKAKQKISLREAQRKLKEYERTAQSAPEDDLN